MVFFVSPSSTDSKKGRKFLAWGSKKRLPAFARQELEGEGYSAKVECEQAKKQILVAGCGLSRSSWNEKTPRNPQTVFEKEENELLEPLETPRKRILKKAKPLGIPPKNLLYTTKYPLH